MSEYWEAAVEAGAREYAYQEEVDYDDMLAYWAQPNVHADDCFKISASEVLTAALPHLRRHIIAELREKAKAQAEAETHYSMAAQDELRDVARWLAAQEATHD